MLVIERGPRNGSYLKGVTGRNRNIKGSQKITCVRYATWQYLRESRSCCESNIMVDILG